LTGTATSQKRAFGTFFLSNLIDGYQLFRFNANNTVSNFLKLSFTSQGPLMTTTDAVNEPVKTGMNAYDMAFVGLMACLMVFVFWLTMVNYEEGMKTEVAKRNGETWVEWLTTAGTTRFNDGYEHGENAPPTSKRKPA
jgi:hypothetical protein